MEDLQSQEEDETKSGGPSTPIKEVQSPLSPQRNGEAEPAETHDEATYFGMSPPKDESSPKKDDSPSKMMMVSSLFAGFGTPTADPEPAAEFS